MSGGFGLARIVVVLFGLTLLVVGSWGWVANMIASWREARNAHPGRPVSLAARQLIPPSFPR